MSVVPDPVPTADKAACLATLAARVRAIEGIGAGSAAGVLPLGLPAMDAALPDGGLPLGCLHEIEAGSAETARQHAEGSATGFAAVLLSRIARHRTRPVLWIGPDDGSDGGPYAPGLAAFGLSPEHLLTARIRRPADRLWALEEAMRPTADGPALSAVLGQVDRLSLAASRRLQLAAEAGRVTLLLLRTNGTPPRTSAAVTRWCVGSLGSAPATAEPGLGDPAWRIELTRCRGGRPGTWAVSWTGAALVETPPVTAGNRGRGAPEIHPVSRPTRIAA